MSPYSRRMLAVYALIRVTEAAVKSVQKNKRAHIPLQSLDPIWPILWPFGWHQISDNVHLFFSKARLLSWLGIFLSQYFIFLILWKFWTVWIKVWGILRILHSERGKINPQVNSYKRAIAPPTLPFPTTWQAADPLNVISGIHVTHPAGPDIIKAVVHSCEKVNGQY